MPIETKVVRAAVVCFSALLPAWAHAEGIDTEHLFGFMIGSDVGAAGEREFQSQTTGRFSKASGSYQTLGQAFELEYVPVKDFRLEVGSTFAAHDINGVWGLEDRSQLGWQGVSLDLRHRFWDRDVAPVGMTLAVESHINRIDDTTAARVRNFGTELTLAFDRELVPNFSVVALNLIYQPEWTHFFGAGVGHDATIGAAFGAMFQMRPGFLVGTEVRYLRKYDGIGLQEFAGQALFAGPTAYFQLSERARLTASWSVQAWGRSVQPGANLDLIDFERHQARLVFGVNF
jgi:hypothetical protein